MIGENLRKAPLIRVVIPFGAGIGMGTMFHSSVSQNMLILSLLLITVLLFISYNYSQTRQYRWVFGLFLITSHIFLGALYYTICQIRLFSNTPGSNGEYLMVEVAEHVKISDEWNVFYADCTAERDDSSWHKISVKLQLYISRKINEVPFSPGDKLIIKGRAIRTAEPTNPGEFNYRKFLDQKGIWGSIYLKDSASIIKVFAAGPLSVANITFKLQDKFLSVFRKFEIKGDELALLAALTIGVRDQIDNEINKAFSASGAMHILSVSGLHVGIVYLVFARLLTLFGKNRYVRIFSVVLQIIFLWFYAFLTGLSPAVNRAAAMFSFLALGKSLNRSASSLNIVAGSALILLLFNPLLIFDMGFELSYLAVISIILFQPFISGLFEFKNYLAAHIWELTALSCAAQIGTFPLSIIYFHQFPNYFMLTNLLVIPLAAAILYLSIAMIFLSWVPYLSIVLAWVLKISLKGMIFSVMTVEHLPYSVLQNISINVSQLVLLYIMIILFASFIHFRLRLHLYGCLVVFAFFLLSVIARNVECFKNQFLIVFNQKGSSLLMVCHGNNAMVLYSGKNPKLPQQALNLSKTISLEQRIKTIHFKCIDSLEDGTFYNTGRNINVCRKSKVVLIRNGNEMIAWLNARICTETVLNDKMKLAVLVAGKIYKKADLDKLKQINAKHLVFDSSCKSALIKETLDTISNGKPYMHDVAMTGAFILKK